MDHPIRGGIVTTATPAASSSLQQQSHRGTVVCTTKDSNAWQPLVTPISILPTSNCVTEIPKESIIANTDFTVTSVIAKRRLSSKKRRSLRNSREEGVLDISIQQQQPSPSSSTHDDTISTASAINTSTSSQSVHQQQQGSVGGGITTGCVPINALPQPNQAVYSQTVPPEVVYQLLHQQHNITSHPSTMVTTSANSVPTATHQPHQLQYIESSTGQQLTYTVPDSSTHQQLPIKSSTVITAHHQYKPSPTTAQHHQVTERQEMTNSNQILEQHQMAAAAQQHAVAAALQQQIHQQQLLQQQQQQQIHYQQQLAMIQQLYGGIQTLVPAPTSTNTLPATIATGINTTGTASNTGIQHPIQIQGSVPVIGHTSHPNQLISVPIQTVYAPPPGHTHPVPIATAFAPPELLLQVQNGSWVSAHHHQSATGAAGFGSCIAGNPVIEPRLLASSLVK